MDAYWVVSCTIDRHIAWTPSRKQPVLGDLSLRSPESPRQPIPKQLPQVTPANPVISRTDTRVQPCAEIRCQLGTVTQGLMVILAHITVPSNQSNAFKFQRSIFPKCSQFSVKCIFTWKQRHNSIPASIYLSQTHNLLFQSFVISLYIIKCFSLQKNHRITA